MVELTAVFDLVGFLGFGGAVALASLNYRDAEVESGFWANFLLASTFGVGWTGVVLAEHLGVQWAVLDTLSVSLLTATVGAFAVGTSGTLSVVNDSKDARNRAVEEREAGGSAVRTADEVAAAAEEAAASTAQISDRASGLSPLADELTAALAGFEVDVRLDGTTPGPAVDGPGGGADPRAAADGGRTPDR